MSKISLEGNASGTGTLTVAAPNTNSNYTINLPAASGDLVVTGGAQTIEFADGSASTPSITNSGDTNTGIFFPAADTIAFTEGGTEAMRINDAGEVLIGGSTSINAANGCLTVQRTNDDPYFALFRDDTSIASTNRIGNIDWYVNDTTSNTPTRVAYILGVASGDHSAGNNPTDLTFATTAASSSTVTERMRITSAGLLQFNSGYGSVATAYGCRAWVNFDGTGTVAIRSSGNVSSITDNGTGDYTVNFATALAADYSSCAFAWSSSYDRTIATPPAGTSYSTTAWRIFCTAWTGSSFNAGQDSNIVTASFFR